MSQKTNGKKIENEEQYNKAREWLIMTAAKLSDPLSDLSEDEEARLNAIYTRTSDAVVMYQRGQLALKFPDLKRVYKEIGYSYQEFDEAVSDESEPIGSEVEETTVEDEPKVDLSAWLDDD